MNTCIPYLHTNPHKLANLGHAGDRISRTALTDGRLQFARGQVVDAETSILPVITGRLPHPTVVSSCDGHGVTGLIGTRKKEEQNGSGDRHGHHHTQILHVTIIIIIIIHALTSRVVGTPQMILQPVVS